MKISYNWLKEFIDLKLSPEETAEKLTLIGLEVENVEEYGSLLEGVIVGEVLSVREHPNADRLLICSVSLGNEKAQIVCGADNVAKGQKVPVATIGSTLPVKLDNGENLTIRKAKLRGEPSEGMICSEAELGIGTDSNGIMVLDGSLKRGTPIQDVLDLYQDTIMDIAITPNRPDATCHLGVARDLSAALDLELHKPFKTGFSDSKTLDEHIDIQIENTEKCHRYTGKAITGISIGESPAWLKNRLKALGVRPVNNVVDVTNYVMLEMGQPLHAFDLDTLKGNKIIVRDFDKERTFETLDHVKRTCSAGTLFICDGEGPVAIAGVMGGVDSEVSDSTENILLESAWFDPGTIRKTAKEQALQTDASYRFERGVDPRVQRVAAERAGTFIAELAGGTVEEGCTDVHPVKTEPRELTLRTAYVNRLLGTDFLTDEIVKLLNGLELKLMDKAKKKTTYRIPTFRPDLQREVDLIEEVGRLYDYNKIPAPRHGKFISPEAISDWEQFVSKVKETAKGLRFREIYTNSLMSDQDAELLGNLDHMIHTLNPITKDMTTLRPSLLYGFLKSVSYNFNRNINGIRFFEVGNVFERTAAGTWYPNIKEETHLLLGLAGLKTAEHWKTEPQPYDIFDLKGVVQSFLNQFTTDGNIHTRSTNGRHLSYYIRDTEVGSLHAVDDALLNNYEIGYPAYIAWFSLNQLQKALAAIPETKYEPVSKFPSFEFDFAVIVDSQTAAGDLLGVIRDTAGESLRELQVFDVFEGESLGENKKSLAFRLSFLDKNKTLTINDIEPIINKVLKALEQKFSAKLRS